MELFDAGTLVALLTMAAVLVVPIIAILIGGGSLFTLPNDAAEQATNESGPPELREFRDAEDSAEAAEALDGDWRHDTDG